MKNTLILFSSLLAIFSVGCTSNNNPVKRINILMFVPGEKNIVKEKTIYDNHIIQKIINSLSKHNVKASRGVSIYQYNILYDLEMMDEGNKCVQKYQYHTNSNAGNHLIKQTCGSSFPLSIYTNDSLLFVLEECFIEE